MCVKSLLCVPYRTQLTYLYTRHLNPCNADLTNNGCTYFVDLAVSGFDFLSTRGFRVGEYDRVSPQPRGYFVCGQADIGSKDVAEWCIHFVVHFNDPVVGSAPYFEFVFGGPSQDGARVREDFFFDGGRVQEI